MGEPPPKKNLEEEDVMRLINGELRRRLQNDKIGLDKLTLLMRGLFSLVALALAGYLYYLAASSLTSADSSSEMVLATTNGGALLLTALVTYWLNYRRPE